METWTNNIDWNYQNISVFLDLSSAFDCVRSLVLLDKIRIYGFGDNFCQLMNSCLSHRSQVVLVNGTYSGYKPNNVGVPQASILGPLLFNIYVNELPTLCLQNCDHNNNNKEIEMNCLDGAVMLVDAWFLSQMTHPLFWDVPKVMMVIWVL